MVENGPPQRSRRPVGIGLCNGKRGPPNAGQPARFKAKPEELGVFLPSYPWVAEG